MLTVGKVNVFGDLVPGAVVKMPDLLFVLHHVGRLSSLLVLHCNVVLDRLEIFPMLKANITKNKHKDPFGGWKCAACVRFLARCTFHLVEPLEEAVFVLCTPRLPLPTGSLLVSSLLLFLGRALALGCLRNPSCGTGHRLSHRPMRRRTVLCPCVIRKQWVTNSWNATNFKTDKMNWKKTIPSKVWFLRY